MRNGGLQQQFTFNEAAEEVVEISVGEFAQRLRGVFAKIRGFDRIAIYGEVSKWSPQANGNLYFTLKDANAALACFAFANDVKKFPEVREGVAIVAVGSVGIRELRSEYQLRVTELRLTGIGALAAQVEALRAKFRAEGLFDEARKRAIPQFPHRIALVSARGKGAEDFERVMARKAPNVEITFIETRVQGVGADVDIADALDKASRANVEIIVLARGGGSYEDLFPFNLEAVIRGIVRAKYPVVTAIGHTGDHHLADDVADRAFATPTAAGEAIAGEWKDVNERLRIANRDLERGINDVLVRTTQLADAKRETLRNATERAMMRYRQRLLEFERQLDRFNPSQRMSERAARFSALRARLAALPRASFDRWRAQLERAEGRLEGENPTRPLERGFAIVSKVGRAVRDVAEVAPGDAIVAKLWRGTLDARVERVSDDG